jgi:hypothetical protein
MDDDDKPSVLANKVVLQLIEHGVSDKLRPGWEDFTSIRVVFRQCGGSWVALLDGDPQHLELLRNIVKAWGQMPMRQVELKRVV